MIPGISRIRKRYTNVATLTRTCRHGLPLRTFHRDYVAVSVVAIRLTLQFVIALQRQVDIANVRTSTMDIPLERIVPNPGYRCYIAFSGQILLPFYNPIYF